MTTISLTVLLPGIRLCPILCEPPLGLTQHMACYDIMSALTLPHEDELRVYYACLAPSADALPAFLANAETGWGGLAGNVDTCIGLRAHYAFTKNFPMLRSQVRC